MDTMSNIESITASLVREYLSRKGLKGTLQTFDKEMPRTEQSISNRVQLAKEMHIEKLMKKNKELPEPFRTMLEVIAKYMKGQGGQISIAPSRAVGVAAENQDKVSPSNSASSSARVKSSSRNEAKQTTAHSDHAPTDKDHTTLNRSEQSDVLLTTLSGDRKGLLGESKRESKQKEREGEHHQKPKTESTDSQSTAGLLNKSSYVKDTGSKSQRNRTRNLGGPVMSSDVTGLRNGRTGRHSGGRVGHSLHPERGSFFVHKDPMENVEVPDMHKSLELESKEPTVQDTMQNKAANIKSSLNAELSPKLSRTIPQQRGSRSWEGLSSKSHEKNNDELVFEDIDEDLDHEIGQLSLGPTKAVSVDYQSKPISLEIAMSLKNLIFGTATATFNLEWRQQSFTFCDMHGLEFGIVQLKGGPCGVLAAVQTFVLKHLIFADKKATEPKRKLHPSPRERTKALQSALTEILWRAGNNKMATVTLPTGASNFIGAGRYKPDQLTETLVLYTFESVDGLRTFLSQHISQFESKSSSGCILLIYSVILSRSVKRVISDMDEPTNRLMGAHGYCTQEMVNLLTTGMAVSNVFDNVMELDSGGPTKSILKGVGRQGDVGLLSLFEHYGSCQVGTNLKSPKFPIWVICSESHFSVLFSLDRNLQDDWKLEKQFDLYYYDGLARQDEEIRITVDTTKECSEYKDGDLVPPLEQCIRTRWKRAVIHWNGSDPIL